MVIPPLSRVPMTLLSHVCAERLRNIIDSTIAGLIADNVVLPNRQVMLLDKSGTVTEAMLRYPFPKVCQPSSVNMR